MSNNEEDHKTTYSSGQNRRQILCAVGTCVASAGIAGGFGPATVTSAPNADTEDEPTDAIIPSGPTVGLETIAEGLTYPTDFAIADGDDRYFVTDQVGYVYMIEDEELSDETFVDVSEQLVTLNEEYDERGLLGITFHPNFEENDRFCLRYSAQPDDDLLEEPEINGAEVEHVEVLSVFETEDNQAQGDIDSEEVLLTVPQTNFVHNSGEITFGPDGYLYVAFGDGGWYPIDDWYEENEGNVAQDTTESLHGGILRIDVDTEDEPYDIPSDNPLADTDDHRGEYYAWGLRNPWGMSFDGDDLYAADVGEVLYESVSRIERGGNYGWNVKEGTHCFDSDDYAEPLENCPDETPEDVRGGEPLLDPILEYPHYYDDEHIGSAVVGGFVYRGDTVSTLADTYVFGDWTAEAHGDPDGSLFIASPPTNNEERHPYNEERDLWQIYELEIDADHLTENGRFARYVSAFGRDDDGELYVMTTESSGMDSDTGEVHRIVSTDN